MLCDPSRVKANYVLVFNNKIICFSGNALNRITMFKKREHGNGQQYI
jgi:hypothetical protein